MNPEQPAESPNKNLIRMIEELEKNLKSKQLELEKLYEGDIENYVQSSQELNLRDQIKNLDDALLMAYNERDRVVGKKTSRIKKIFKNLRKF